VRVRPVFADPKTDFVFKRIFGAVERTPLLIALLNNLLELEGSRRIRDLQHLSLEQHIALPELRLSIVDVRCTDASGRRFVVEMQLAKVKGIEKRIVYNASKAYVMQLRSAEEYPTLCDVVGVTICNFKLFPKKDKGNPPKEGYQTGPSTFEDFKKVFGEQIAKQCWSDNDIAQIREYRHALVHENGRLSHAREEKLKLLAIKPEANKPETLVIQNDQNQSVLHKLDSSLVIMTHENKTAYNKLKSCIDGIVDYTIANYASKVS